MLVFYFFAAIAIWLGLLSLRGGLGFLAYVRREVAVPVSDYAPFVSVIAPFRGIDEGLKENLTALFDQRYPAYEIIFVTGRADDPALNIVEEVRTAMSDKRAFVADSPRRSLPATDNLQRRLPLPGNDNLKIVGHSSETHRPIPSRVVIAGDAADSGQKVHNLRVAVNQIDHQSEAFVFVDTDARPHEQWLRSLVAPLGDGSVGAATGYRWFLPKGGVASHLRSVWNASIASALGPAGEKNFCWGGSIAIRRTTFDRLKVAERWRGTVSDDFTLTSVLHEAKLPIHFAPHCLIASWDDCSFRELLEFTTRQLRITRVYATHLWQAVLVGGLFFVPVFFGGIALVIARAMLGLPIVTPVVLLSIVFVLGAAKSWIRLRAVSLALANYDLSPGKGTLAHLVLWPIASALFLYNALAAACSRRINWRGISYELKSPTEAVIISRDPD